MGKVIGTEDEVIELVFDDKELNELIEGLNQLKNTKSHLHFNIDKDNQFLIHHKEDELL